MYGLWLNFLELGRDGSDFTEFYMEDNDLMHEDMLSYIPIMNNL